MDSQGGGLSDQNCAVNCNVPWLHLFSGPPKGKGGFTLCYPREPPAILLLLPLLCLLPPTAKPKIKMNDSQAPDAPLRVTVKVGEEVTLDCEAQGSPTPLVTWTKDTHPLLPVTNRYPAPGCGPRKGPGLGWREAGLKVVVT